MVTERHVAIIGAGLMGTGLARLFAASGWKVTISDPDVQAGQRLLAALDGGAEQLSVHTGLGDAVAGACIVIEAAPERPALKQKLFADLASLTGPDTILATNSSVIPVGVVTELLSDTDAARVIGTHFWNPPDIIPLVEVIQGPRTASASIEIGMTILRAVGKEPVHVRRDVVPGNRLQHALWREAMALVDEGVCTPEDVDHIIKRSFGLRLPVLGPLENADLVGLDLTAQIHEVVLPSLSQAAEPSAGLRDRLANGRLGVKSGDGFYDDWTDVKVTALRRRLSDHLAAMLREG